MFAFLVKRLLNAAGVMLAVAFMALELWVFRTIVGSSIINTSKGPIRIPAPWET